MTRPSAKEIEAEAAIWAIRLDREQDDPVLWAEIEAWASDDPRRRGALLQAQAAWSLLGMELCRGGEPGPEIAVTPEYLEGHCHDTPTPRWRFARMTGGLAAMALLILLVGGPMLWLRGTEYKTGLGEVRRVPLGDGSMASINSDAAIAVSLQPNQRIARIAHGEAWFRVAKDKARPFIVEAGRVRVRAVGTAFAVRRLPNGAEVQVTEGVVEIWATGAEGHRVRLGVGGRALITNDSYIRQEPGGASAIDRSLAWRSGRIDLAGETLEQAITEFNRYNAVKIELAVPEVGAEQLYGIFHTDDPAGFSDAVGRSLGLRVARQDDRIILSR